MIDKEEQLILETKAERESFQRALFAQVKSEIDPLKEENKKLRDTLKLIAALIEEQDESDRTITEIEIYANAVNTLAALASHNGTTGKKEE